MVYALPKAVLAAPLVIAEIKSSFVVVLIVSNCCAHYIMIRCTVCCCVSAAPATPGPPGPAQGDLEHTLPASPLHCPETFSLWPHKGLTDKLLKNFNMHAALPWRKVGDNTELSQLGREVATVPVITEGLVWHSVGMASNVDKGVDGS